MEPREDEIHHGETLKAYNRIGNKPEDIINWLLHFAQSDLLNLSKGDLINLQYELICFGRYRFPGSRRERVFFAPISKPPDLLLDHIQIFQKCVKDALVDILAGKQMSFKIDSFQFHLVPYGKDVDHISWDYALTSKSTLTILTYSLAYLLAGCAGKLRRCPGCQKIFLGRDNQYHCSKKCQAKLAMVRARTRQGHPPGGRRGRPPKLSTNRPVKNGGKK